MSSPEENAGSSKRRRLNGGRLVKAERVESSTATLTRDSSSTVQPSPAPSKGRVREQSASRVNGYGHSEDDDEVRALSVTKRPKKEEPVELDLDGAVIKREAAGVDDSDDDPDGPIDDGDGLMADLSPEARERLAMRDADGCVSRTL